MQKLINGVETYMTQKFTPEEIKQAVEDIKKLKPEYAPMLDLYEKIFSAQEISRESVRLDAFVIPADKLKIKLDEQFPLVTIPEFKIDSKEAVKLFGEICDILTSGENELSGSVKQIVQLVSGKKIDTEKLFSSFINEEESVFDDIEKEHGIDKQILAFIVFNSLKPSLAVFSQNIAVHLEKAGAWEKGYCPVCGSAPEISLFEENGKRFLVCGFCSHKWASKRIYCPFCENSDHETLRYIEIEDEEEHRADVCDKCKKYIKTTDVKKTTRLVYPALEYQATPYIDLLIEDMGYTQGTIKK